MPYSENKKRRLYGALLCCAFLFAVRDAFFRPLWFDEVITVTNFTIPLSPLQIYLKYNIPNNHIIFTLLLKFYSYLYDIFLPFIDFTLRIPSLLISIGALILLYSMIEKLSGRKASLLLCLCFTLSLPFQIYSVAIRGYMLSFLLVTAAFILAWKAIRKKRMKYFAGYFLISLLAVGTIPSNLIALLALPLSFLFSVKKEKLSVAGYISLFMLPLAAFACFYIPIFPKLMKNMRLDQGWENGCHAAFILYSAFLISFLPVIIIAVAGVFRSGKKDIIKNIPGLLVFLFPLPCFVLLAKAPFPRVFFPLWALWTIILCVPLKKGIKLISERPVIFIFTVSAVFLWGIAEQAAAPFLSEKIIGKNEMDDYFYPYYADTENFNPLLTARKLKKMTDDNCSRPIFVSFDSDPYSIIFYSGYCKLSDDIIIFDSPLGKVPFLPEGTIIVVKGDEDLIKTLKRFRISNVHPFDLKGYQKIYMTGNSSAGNPP